MNVLIVTNQLGLGGAEQFAVRLANGLHHRGHHVVVAAEPGEMTDRLDREVTYLDVPARAKTPWGLWRFARVLSRAIASHDIDVVHANSPNTALAARLARGLQGPPVLTTAHGSWRPWTKPLVARLFDWGSDRVMGCSEALTRDLVIHGLHPGKALTVHNGIPFRDEAPPTGWRLAVRRELGLADSDPVVLTVARLSAEKGLSVLIRAMPEVWKRHPDAWLLIAGDGPEWAALEAQAASLGGRIRFLGLRSDVPRLLAAADAFALPSLTEGLPLALAEAMGAGVPVVASEVGGVPELIRDGESGWLVPPGDPGMLAGRIQILLSEVAQARAMARAGRERVRAEFTLDRMLGRFETLYQAQRRPRLAPVT